MLTRDLQFKVRSKQGESIKLSHKIVGMLAGHHLLKHCNNSLNNFNNSMSQCSLGGIDRLSDFHVGKKNKLEKRKGPHLPEI